MRGGTRGVRSSSISIETHTHSCGSTAFGVYPSVPKTHKHTHTHTSTGCVLEFARLTRKHTCSMQSLTAMLGIVASLFRETLSRSVSSSYTCLFLRPEQRREERDEKKAAEMRGGQICPRPSTMPPLDTCRSMETLKRADQSPFASSEECMTEYDPARMISRRRPSNVRSKP